MRIRKRQVPLPLSSLSPVPLSDLRLDPPVQLRPSNPLPPRRRQCSAADFDLELDLEKEEEKKDEEEKEKSNDSRPSIFFVPPTSSHSVSSSSNQVERWCDGDKAFPLKKRRGSFERRGSAEAAGFMEKEAAAVKMKTKMNNKCDLDHHHGDAQKEEREVVLDSGAGGSSKKKRGGRGGAVLMEGSRCSRVNGRGWRCCQQTLVGYSLCEHHLGKGRLRSMASVRSRSLAAAAGNNAPKKNKKSVDLVVPSSDHKSIGNDKAMSLENRSKPKLSSDEPVSSCFLLSDEDEDEEVKDDDDKKKPLMLTNRKRMRLGMVKARSMSSLLGQPQPIINNSIGYAVPADHHHHNHMQIRSED